MDRGKAIDLDALHGWYQAGKRDLPWRRTSDPYAIWISEVMLQQTTVATAGPRWTRFLERFPTVASLASATEDQALAEWSGLGYYGRARNLRRAALALVALGSFPRTAKGLLALPGVGDYTAAAVASIAFGERVAVVDGNVIRVLCRVFALPLEAKAPSTKREIQRLADALVPARNPGDHNQALMELGATVCAPRAPRCPACPLTDACLARRAGTPEAFPIGAAPKVPRRIRLAAGIAFRGGRLVLVPDAHFVRAHLNVPTAVVPDGGDARLAIRERWKADAGRVALKADPVGRLRHSVLDRRYAIEVFRIREGAPGRMPESRPTLLTRAEIEARPHGGFLRKLLRTLSSG